MDTFNFLIVKLEKAYEDTITTDSGLVLYNDTTVDQVQYINREAEVVSVPKGVILNVGDKVIIHHNIARKRIGTDGEDVESDYWIKDNLYFVPLSEVFMSKRGEEKWKALAPYTFIKTVDAEKVTSDFIIVPDSVLKDDHEGKKNLEGIMAYPNSQLIEMGVKEGDTIVFEEDSEYKFEIEGETYYKMQTNDILAVVEE